MLDKYFIALGRMAFILLLTFVALEVTSEPFAYYGPISWYRYLLHSLDIITHEGGHFVLYPLQLLSKNDSTMFIVALNGSLMQWSVPIAIALYFLVTKQFYAAFIALFWLGHSLDHSVYYIADAMEMELGSIFGEGKGMHDWNFILHYLGVLYMDDSIARGFWYASKIIVWISVIGAWIFSVFPIVSKEYKE